MIDNNETQVVEGDSIPVQVPEQTVPSGKCPTCGRDKVNS